MMRQYGQAVDVLMNVRRQAPEWLAPVSGGGNPVAHWGSCQPGHTSGPDPYPVQ
jgi:hypothetical protein